MDKEIEDDVEDNAMEITSLALLCFCANLAQKLKIKPEEFYNLLKDIDGANEFMKKVAVANLESKIKEFKKEIK